MCVHKHTYSIFMIIYFRPSMVAFPYSHQSHTVISSSNADSQNAPVSKNVSPGWTRVYYTSLAIQNLYAPRLVCAGQLENRVTYITAGANRALCTQTQVKPSGLTWVVFTYQTCTKHKTDLQPTLRHTSQPNCFCYIKPFVNCVH
jgi:hypothetical protein